MRPKHSDFKSHASVLMTPLSGIEGLISKEKCIENLLGAEKNHERHQRQISPSAGEDRRIKRVGLQPLVELAPRGQDAVQAATQTGLASEQSQSSQDAQPDGCSYAQDSIY